MKYVVMCIGNKDGGDDGAGPLFAENLKKENLKDVFVIDCGTVPENYTVFVKRQNPENLVIVDAVEMGLAPGEIRIVPYEKIGVMHVSTHGIPLSVLINYLKPYAKKIFLIGIQPKVFSGKMTDSVKKSASMIVDLIKNNDLEKIEKYV